MPAEVDHPFARFAELIAAREGPVEEDRRRDTLAGLVGRVIEIGSGSGPNFRHYPAGSAPDPRRRPPGLRRFGRRPSHARLCCDRHVNSS